MVIFFDDSDFLWIVINLHLPLLFAKLGGNAKDVQVDASKARVFP
jgi:hypothetical protein